MSLVLSLAIGKIFGIPPKTLTIEEIIRLFPLGIWFFPIFFPTSTISFPVDRIPTTGLFLT